MAAKPTSLTQLVENQPRNAVQFSVQVIFTATNVPRRLPPLVVPPGCSVQLGGTNGTAANAQLAQAALYPEQLFQGARLIPPSNGPQDAVSFPVDNLYQIWVMGTEGDGVYVSVSGSAIG